MVSVSRLSVSVCSGVRWAQGFWPCLRGRNSISGSSQVRGPVSAVMTHLSSVCSRNVSSGRSITDLGSAGSIHKVIFSSWACVSEEVGWADLFRERVAPLLPFLTDVPSPHFPGGRARALRRLPPQRPSTSPWGQIGFRSSGCGNQTSSPLSWWGDHDTRTIDP